MWAIFTVTVFRGNFFIDCKMCVNEYFIGFLRKRVMSFKTRLPSFFKFFCKPLKIQISFSFFQVNQDQLWKLFDIIPGLDYCQMNGDFGEN